MKLFSSLIIPFEESNAAVLLSPEPGMIRMTRCTGTGAISASTAAASSSLVGGSLLIGEGGTAASGGLSSA
ncbi:hypothetical protein D3C79_945870 [compost metagenome]